jgi:hypothetical protein
MSRNLTILAVAMSASGAMGFGFNYFSRTNQGNVTLPQSASDTLLFGWELSVRSDGSPCREGLGFEYTEGASTHSQSRPMSLFFNPSGQLSAISVRAWFVNTSSYNPDTWQAPLFGSSGESERWVTVATRDPSSACIASPVDPTQSLLGDRLIFDSAGGLGSEFSVTIPLEEPEDPDGAWKQGACMPDMSRHWGYPLDGESDSLLGDDHGVHVLPVSSCCAHSVQLFCVNQTTHSNCIR